MNDWESGLFVIRETPAKIDDTQTVRQHTGTDRARLGAIEGIIAVLAFALALLLMYGWSIYHPSAGPIQTIGERQ